MKSKGFKPNCFASRRDSVNSTVERLQSRKYTLEAKIKDKNEELKALCLQEAEVTGELPREYVITLGLGESPPVLRRCVRTTITHPENLIKLKSKEKETLTTLEIECNSQAVSKSARRFDDATDIKIVQNYPRLRSSIWNRIGWRERGWLQLLFGER